MNAPRMNVEWWKNEGYFEGGCWALVLNNRLFAEAAEKGRHRATEKRMRTLAHMWNRDMAQAETVIAEEFK